MKLNTKLIISYIIIIVAPLILMYILGSALFSYQVSRIEQYYGIETDIYECLFNQLRIQDKMTDSIYSQLEIDKANGSYNLENEDYLETVNDYLKDRNSYLFVMSKNKYIYIGADLDINPELADVMSYIRKLNTPNYDGVAYNEITLYYEEEDTDQFLIKSESFRYSSGSYGTFYIVTNTSDSISEIKSLVWEIGVLAICVIVLVGSILTWWIYKSVVKPLKRLRIATRKIAKGNLDFTIASEDKDEFGQLFNSFEKMRKHLKISIEKQLENEEESRELISNISHDLKTPLTAIKGYVEGIIDGVADSPDKVDKYLKTVYNKANDMNTLISKLSLYSKFNSNKVSYNFANIDINGYFMDCMEEIEVELEGKNTDVAYKNKLPHGLRVIADPEQLKRVINNVISNSLKYMDKEYGKITITLQDYDDEYIHVSLADNGKGVKEEELNMIFQRFFRTDSSRNSSKGGSGIGLAIVKKIIEAHDGRIWATGVEREGLTINFTLKKTK